MKNRIIFVLTTLAILTTPALAGPEGSTGTTGGGDISPEVLKILPESILVKAERKLQRGENIYLGIRKCYKLFPCKTYAQKVELQAHFTKNDFCQGKTGVMTELTYRGKNKTKIETTRDSWPNGFDLFDYDMKSIELYWNNEQITHEEYGNRVQAIQTYAIEQIDFLNSLTVIDALGIERFILTINAMSTFRHAIGSKLETTIQSHADDVMATAQKSINEQGVCDFAVYEQLNAKLSNWKVGSRSWLNRLQVETGLNVTSVQAQASRIRGHVREFIADEVEPACAAGYKAQTIVEEKEDIILKEGE